MRLLILTLLLLSSLLTAPAQRLLTPGDSLVFDIAIDETQAYHVKTRKGEFFDFVVHQKGIDLIVVILAPGQETGKEFDTPNGMNGPELFSFESTASGTYKIIVKPLDDSYNAKRGSYDIVLRRKLSAAAYQKVLQRERAEEAEFMAWLKQNAKTIQSIRAGSGFEDLSHLKELLKNKQVVALGEATHGTREFFQMKHRLLEFLVEELGFTAFAIEASYSRCKYINDYVLTGRGNLDSVTVIHGFATWSTEEVRDMIQWMKVYNDAHPDRKIQFVGFDLQVNDAAAFAIDRFYGRMHHPHHAEIQRLLRRVVDIERKGGIFSGDTTVRTLIRPIEGLIAALVDKQGEHLMSTPPETFDDILRHHRVLRQYLISYSYDWIEQVNRDNRDTFMAENILSWLSVFPAGTKVVVWAHNGHVAKDYLDGIEYPSMGSHLKRVLKDRYFSIGFDFYRGRFQANDVDLKDSPGWEEHEVGEAPRGNLGYYFHNAGLKNSFISLSPQGAGDVIERWLTKKRVGTYSIGSQFSSRWQRHRYIAPIVLHNAFDALIYIEQSSRAIPRPSMVFHNFRF